MRLKVALAVSCAVFALEAAGGVLAHSLALATDAVHVLTDVGAAALALWAAGIATRPADAQRTFGYGRSTVLAALANAVVLVVLTIFIVFEAGLRFISPTPVAPTIMIAAAAMAIVANVCLALYLARDPARSLNVKAVGVHVIGDVVISVGVVIGAVIIATTGWLAADPLISILAAGVVLYAAWGIVKDALNVLLEGAPRGVALGDVKAALESTLALRDVHDLHVWSVSYGGVAASLHVRVDAAQLAASPNVVAQVKQLLRERFAVTHCTVEVECDDCAASC